MLRFNAQHRSHSAGFTLMEVLVVVAIIGVLLALLLPAVQQAREASRRVQCGNHLRQLALGILEHVDATGRLPAGGWGFGWNGFPERGNDRHQPGGWIYNILPFIEQAALHDLGAGTTGAEMEAASRERISTPVALLYCSSRRAAVAYPAVYPLTQNPFNTAAVTACARNDYAINGGDTKLMHGPGPADFATADSGGHGWLDPQLGTGISMQRSEYRLADVLDGTSQTYLVGEKYLNPDHYETGLDAGDNEHAYSGDEQDIIRWGTIEWTPMRDRSGFSDLSRFGSAHAEGLNMAFCDGHVRRVRYNISGQIHQDLANRRNGRSG